MIIKQLTAYNEGPLPQPWVREKLVFFSGCINMISSLLFQKECFVCLFVCLFVYLFIYLFILFMCVRVTYQSFLMC